MSKIAVIYHSGFGHTEKQAEHILKGVLSVPGVEAELIEAKQASDRLNELQNFDGMLFGAPTYMGSVSAGFKEFMDKSSDVWYSRAWKDKFAGGFTNSHSMSGDKFNSLVQLATFAAQHGMIWVSLGISNESSEEGKISGDVNTVNRFGSNIGPVAQSDNDSPEVTPGYGDLKTAELYGERFALAVLRWQNGAK